MTVSAFVQDPNAVRDYGIDWTLDVGDTIATSTWTRFKDDEITATTEITIVTNSFTNTPAPKTIVRVSYPAPILGATHILVNHVTTTAGRQEDHKLILTCQNE